MNIKRPHSRGLNDKMKELRKEHQQVIEERDSVMALLSDDLQDLDKQIQAIKYENVGLQGDINAKYQQIERCENTINRLRERYVAHAKNPYLDSLEIIIRKYTSTDNYEQFGYPYYVARIQRHAIGRKR